MTDFIKPKFQDEVEDKVKSAASNLGDKAKSAGGELQDKAEKAKDVMQKSSEDWVDYIKKHPIQTIILGLACLGLGSLMSKPNSK